MPDAPEEAPTQSGKAPSKKLIILVIVGVVMGVAYTQLGDTLSLQNLAAREAELRQFQTQNPLLVFGAAFLIYVLVTGLSLPGAAVLTLVFGWYFGFLSTVPLVSFASTAGATMAFLLSRFLFRDAIQNKFGERLVSFNESLEREGPFYLFTLRLIPAVPFFVINVVMGLTPIKTKTYWWVSQLGMLPGTLVYVYAGSSVPNLQALADKGINAVFEPRQMAQIIGAFVLLGIFPLIVRYTMKFIGNKEPQAMEPSIPDNEDPYATTKTHTRRICQ